MAIPCSTCKSSSCIISHEHLNDLFTNNVQEALFELKKCKSKLSLKKLDDLVLISQFLGRYGLVQRFIEIF